MASLSDIKPLPPASETGQESREDSIFKRVFLSPAVAVLLVFSIFPLLWSLGVSVTTCQRSASAAGAEAPAPTVGSVMCLGNPADFSLRNYERLPTDSRLLTAIRNTLFYVIVGVTVQYCIGLLLAMLLQQEFVGRRFFRLVFLLPMMLTPVAAGYVGRMMFDSGISPLAQFQRTIGTFLSNLTGLEVKISVPFITDPGVAPFTMVLIDSWQWIPFMTLLLLAGLQAIPDEVYEAARVDGANARQLFMRITFPILLPISLTAILIRSLEMFKLVDIINVVTGGGPGTSTESLVMYVYDTALSFGNYGYAAAMGFVLLVMVIIFATVFLAISRRLTRQQLGVG
ncbi:MAG: sugar ABC transporter permease [Anaerolineae bacterium]|nr:sugar ABC transporter permease [Anaerolineae bacterium]